MFVPSKELRDFLCSLKYSLVKIAEITNTRSRKRTNQTENIHCKYKTEKLQQLYNTQTTTYHAEAHKRANISTLIHPVNINRNH